MRRLGCGCALVGFPDGLAAFLFGGSPRIKKRQDSAPSRASKPNALGMLGFEAQPNLQNMYLIKSSFLSNSPTRINVKVPQLCECAVVTNF